MAETRKKRSENRQRTVLIAFRLLPEEGETVRRLASAVGLSVSAYVRSRALAVPGSLAD